jgi:AcrR family transcriptional regulator
MAVPGKRGPVRPDAINVVRGQETRRRILDAARARILAKGFDALRLDDLAADAGVTKAAVVKSIGGKAALLLELGEEDRQTRVAVIRAGLQLRSALRRRLSDVIRALLGLDVRRLNIVTAYVGYMWFWTGDDHRRSQSMIDDTRVHLCELVAAASGTPLSPKRLDLVCERVLVGYGVALRNVYYRRATIDESVRFVVEFALD